MAIIDKTVKISKPVYDLLKFVEELACDALEKKGAAELQQDLIAGIPLLSALSEIRPDYDANPDAVKNAVALAGEDFATRLMAILSKGAASPGK